MRSRSLPLLIFATVASVAILAGCPAGIRRAELHHAVHERSLPSFAAWWTASRAAQATRWDLTTDGCSHSPDVGPTFDFRWPCIRHDLAWRNIGRLIPPPTRREARALRRLANERFRLDMVGTCRQRPTWHRPSCRLVAATYHRAVEVVT
jgi:hypothetical protein